MIAAATKKYRLYSVGNDRVPGLRGPRPLDLIVGVPAPRTPRAHLFNNSARSTIRALARLVKSRVAVSECGRHHQILSSRDRSLIEIYSISRRRPPLARALRHRLPQIYLRTRAWKAISVNQLAGADSATAR